MRQHIPRKIAVLAHHIRALSNVTPHASSFGTLRYGTVILVTFPGVVEEYESILVMLHCCGVGDVPGVVLAYCVFDALYNHDEYLNTLGPMNY